MRLILAALAAAFSFACASSPLRHPTPDHRIAGCFLSCPSGRWFSRANHICSGSMYFLDLTISGEEDVAGDPSESRWFTGSDPIWVEHEAIKRLAAKGITPADAAIWSTSYGEERDALRRQYGDDATRAAYNKQDVVLHTCATFIQMRSSGRSAEQRGVHPGEPDPRGERP